MNNLKKILPLPILALLILAACNNPLAKEASQNVVAPKSVQPAVTDTTASSETSASVYGSGLKCSDLQVAMNRQNCETQMNNLIGSLLESEILDSFDLQRCNELPAGIAERCEEQLADSGVQGPVSTEELLIFGEAVEGTLAEPGEGGALPMPEYNVSDCAQLTTAGYKEYCEAAVTRRMERSKLDQIFQSGSVNDCDGLTGEDTKFDCKLFFGVAPEAIEPPAPPAEPVQ